MRVYLNPCFACRFAVDVRNDVRRAFARVFIANKLISNLLEDAGAEAHGADCGKNSLNQVVCFHVMVFLKGDYEGL